MLSTKLARTLFVGGLLASVGRLAVACSVDEENPVVPRPQNNDVVNSPDGQVHEDGSVAGGLRCDAYGGRPQLKDIAIAVLQAVKLDCRIASTLKRTQSDDRAIQCWQAFVAASFQCDDPTLPSGITDDKGVPCARPIDDPLSEADFDAFVQDYQVTLVRRGVAPADVDAALADLEAMRATVVGGTVPDDKYTQCAANCADAGAACRRDGGASTTPPRDASAPRDASPPRDAAKD